MKFDAAIVEIKAKKLAGVRYEKEVHSKFRDCVTLGINGRLLFERYCYGEAASKVCQMLAPGTDENGEILWDYAACDYSGKEEAPRQLTKFEGGDLYFDDKRWAWQPQAELKAVPALGLGKMKMLFNRG